MLSGSSQNGRQTFLPHSTRAVPFTFLPVVESIAAFLLFNRFAYSIASTDDASALRADCCVVLENGDALTGVINQHEQRLLYSRRPDFTVSPVAYQVHVRKMVFGKGVEVALGNSQGLSPEDCSIHVFARLFRRQRNPPTAKSIPPISPARRQ